MIKLLWIGDSPTVSTGLGRVTQCILERLWKLNKYDISVLGINHAIGDPHILEGKMKIYPARSGGHPYGFNRVAEVVAKSNPDVVLINNDLWILNEYMNVMPAGQKVISYVPIDAGPMMKSWTTNIMDRGLNTMVAYTAFGKNILEGSGFEDIKVVGHGVDTDDFYPVSDARQFFGLPTGKFIIQNVNRNQPRKRLDLFLKAGKMFIESLPVEDRDNIILFYHGVVKDLGWDLLDLADRLEVAKYFYISDQAKMTAAAGLPVDVLCKTYNLADVQVNTSMGEGFGLTNFESAACRTPQVVGDHSACSELWKGHGELIKVSHYDTLTGGINTEGAVIDLQNLVEILTTLYQDSELCKQLGANAYNYVHEPQFTWEYVASQFDHIIDEALQKGVQTTKRENK